MAQPICQNIQNKKPSTMQVENGSLQNIWFNTMLPISQIIKNIRWRSMASKGI